MVSEEALQIAEKRRDVKSKGERERYTQECRVPRIVRRDKKAFSREQCKEVEENKRMKRTTDLFKKIRDTKAIFHAKLGKIKDRKRKDLKEAKEIKKRW